MTTTPDRTRNPLRTTGVAVTLVAFAALLGGCQWPPPNMWGQQQQRPGEYPKNPALNRNDNKPPPTVSIVSDEEHSDIIQVAKFLPTNPWLIFDPLDGRIDGIKITVYLDPRSSETSGSGKEVVKGVFGDGTIIVQLFENVAEQGQRSDMKLAHTWELSPEDTYPWRARKQTLLGWGYGLRLQWPSELQLGGKRIAILVSYRRSDGVLISSSKPIVQRVPLRGV